MRLLGRVKGKVVRGGRKERREEEQEEGDLGKEEINKVIKRLKDGKTMGRDGIPNEVWKYAGKEIGGWAWRMCNKVWRGKDWLEEWKDGTIIPIVKKGKGKGVKNYRGVTLMPSLCNIKYTRRY